MFVRDFREAQSLPRDPFCFTFKDGTSVHASDMVITDGPQVGTRIPAGKALVGCFPYQPEQAKSLRNVKRVTHRGLPFNLRPVRRRHLAPK
jgi:hypothetical protein